MATIKKQGQERDQQVVAYLRVSTDKQDLKNQRLEILEYAHRHDFSIDHFFQVQMSSRKTQKARRIEELLEFLCARDILIVAEISRLGRSVGQIVTLLDDLIRQKVRFIAIKENMDILGNGEKDLQTTVMSTMFGLFAEIERKLISERTKAGLVAAREKGKILGRPKGRKGASKLDGKEDAIREDLSHGVAKAAIARKCGVSRTTLVYFLESRGLDGDVTPAKK